MRWLSRGLPLRLDNMHLIPKTRMVELTPEGESCPLTYTHNVKTERVVVSAASRKQPDGLMASIRRQLTSLARMRRLLPSSQETGKSCTEGE